MGSNLNHEDQESRNHVRPKWFQNQVSGTNCIFNHLKSSFSLGKLQNILVEQLYMCVEFLWKSERYELIADVNKPIIAVFEKQRDFKVCVLYPKEAMEIFNLSWQMTYSMQT